MVNMTETLIEDPVGLKERGNAHFKDGFYEEALSCYTKALRLGNEEEKAVLYKNRAACYLKTNECEKAIEDCARALEIAPGDSKALFRRCQAYEQLGRINEAYKDALEWLRIDPKNTAVQPVLARLYLKVQETAKEQASLTSRVAQMFDYVFGDKGDRDKRIQAANNLLVLAKEKAGAEKMVQDGIIEKLGAKLKTEKDQEMLLAFVRVIGELCKGNPARTKDILKQLGVTTLIGLFNQNSEQHVNGVEYCFQCILNALGGMNSKEGQSADEKLLEENKQEIHQVMKAVTHSVNSRIMSPLGRDALLEVVMKNVEHTALNWSVPLIDCDGVYRILEVASELNEFQHESSMSITPNTRTTVAVTLQKIYDSLSCDKHRDLFREKVDEFVKDKLRGPEIESKVRVTAAITAMLQGPLDVGNYCIAQQGVLEMMLVMAGSEDLLQQTVAAEAIIAAASKKDKCTSIVSMGFNILKQLYQSKNDSIRVRALVGLCKISSLGGTDASIKPFAEGSQNKLSAACRKFLINPAKDKDLRKWAAEGLSYLTLDATVKEELVEDKAALQALIELAKVGDQSCLYGVVTTLVNLTNSYDRQELIPEMVELAKFAKQHVPVEHEKDSKEFLDRRIKAIAQAGITVALVCLAKTEAVNSRELISRVFNAVCEQKELRGVVVQQGGAKVLIPMALEGTEKGKTMAAQALARIAITINPEIAFPGQRCVEVVRPLLKLLHFDCSGLQNFEALMGLTNLAQVSATVRNRIIGEQGISTIEAYMFEDHEMLKRAATQCMVNMLLSDETIKVHEKKNDRVKFWTLLTVDDDADTALAAAGGLAILTGCSKKCCKKVFEPKDWLDILRTLLANENVELQHRGSCIVCNMMSSCKPVAEKLIETDIMELLLVVSQLEDPSRAKAVDYAKKSLEAAEEWKLIQANPGEEDADEPE